MVTIAVVIADVCFYITAVMVVNSVIVIAVVTTNLQINIFWMVILGNILGKNIKYFTCNNIFQLCFYLFFNFRSVKCK